MRFVSMLAAAVALWVQPAEAVTFHIEAQVEGTRTDINCDASIPDGCTTFTPLSFLFQWDGPLEQYDAATGRGFFLTAHETVGRFLGEAHYLGNGQWLGGRFDWFYRGGDRTCQVGFECHGFDESGRGESFLVTEIQAAPVPEPATWALMLLGFGVIGWSMRHQIRSQVPA